MAKEEVGSEQKKKAKSKTKAENTNSEVNKSAETTAKKKAKPKNLDDLKEEKSKGTPIAAKKRVTTSRKKLVGITESEDLDEQDGIATEEDESSNQPTKGRSREGRSLVIVESPGKIKTISKFLGKDYVVKASYGHVRDLPSKELGIDLEKNFEPKYIVLKEKTKVIKELKQVAKTCEKLYLAPDPDREGEAIAWHLAESLNFNPEKTYRVTFTEITKKGIMEGFQNAHTINDNLVYAQQARRILDRIVGYKLSPLLWKKVAKGLSGGRVQSVAVRVICEREEEIKNFKSEEYWKITAKLSTDKKATPFDALLHQWQGKEFDCKNQKDAHEISDKLKKADYIVKSIEKKSQTSRASPPFITSTLQQAASTNLRFSAKNTMRIAQQLYEGVELGSEGMVSLITYMRTDSFNLSDEARTRAKEYILKNMSPEYYPETPNFYKSKKNAQEAHEAIRPTDCFITPDAISKYLSPEQFKLYNLIWRRFLASQMAPAKIAITNIEIVADKGLFKTQGRIIEFDGFQKIQQSSEDKNQILPEFTENEKLNLNELTPSQHFTQPPARYTEASLVRLLEKEEIGRPATYAAIISTIQERGYVELENRKFKASELGMLVNSKLVEFFPSILDLRFTAEMEAKLDSIAEGDSEWAKIIETFYGPFSKDLDKATADMESEKNKQEGHGSCELCNLPMVLRWSKKGKFVGCSGYPKCTNTKSLNPEAKDIGKDLGVSCHLCHAPMILKISKRGKFAGCSNYPDCNGTMPLGKNGEVFKIDLINNPCEKCGSPMLLRTGRRGPFISCSTFPTCKNTKPIPKDENRTEEKSEEKSEETEEIQAEA